MVYTDCNAEAQRMQEGTNGYPIWVEEPLASGASTDAPIVSVTSSAPVKKVIYRDGELGKKILEETGDSITVKGSSIQGLTAPIGMEFDGWKERTWNAGRNGKALGNAYQVGQSVSLTGTLTLEAQWKESEGGADPQNPGTDPGTGSDPAPAGPAYTVTYHATAGDSGYQTREPVDELGMTASHTLRTLESTGLTSRGIFVAWELGGRSFQPGETYSISADTSFVAAWRTETQETVAPSAGTRDSDSDSGSDSGSAPVSLSDSPNGMSATTSPAGATVQALTSAQIDQVNADIAAGLPVTVDLSGLSAGGSPVRSASLPNNLLQTMADAAALGNAEAELSVDFGALAVTFNAAALASIADQLGGADLKLGMEATRERDMNPEQRFALMAFDVQTVLDATMSANGRRISDFGGGAAGVTMPLDIPAGYAPEDLQVIYVDQRGGTEDIPCSYENGEAVYDLSHFSKYALAFEARNAAPAPAGFADVSAEDWYFDAVRWASGNSVMNGMGDGTFAPYLSTTRAMVAQILYNLEGRPDPAGEGVDFSDVAAGAWYADAVRWASAEGIVKGNEDGTFAPDAPITREQLLTIIYRYAVSRGVDVAAAADLAGYSDFAEISGYAVDALRWAVGSGLASGRTAETLNPGDTANRAEVATILMRYCTSVGA